MLYEIDSEGFQGHVLITEDYVMEVHLNGVMVEKWEVPLPRIWWNKPYMFDGCSKLLKLYNKHIRALKKAKK